MEPGTRYEKVTLPCGYISDDGTLYDQATVRELDYVAEMRLGTSGGDNPMQEIVASCIVALHSSEEKATLDLPSDIRDLVVPALLKGDWDWLLLKIVHLTLYKTEKYVFSALCPNPECKTQDSHGYDLAEVDFRQMPDRRMRTITVNTRNGAKVVFRHLRGIDNEALMYVADSSENVIAKLLAIHLGSVDDVVFTDYTQPGVSLRLAVAERVRALEAVMPFLNERETVRAMLHRAGGRPDLQVHTRCEHCNTKWQHRLPVDPTLLLPHANAAAEKINPALAF